MPPVMNLSSQPLARLIHKILSHPNGAGQDEVIEGRIRAEQINNLKRYLTGILLANICNALVLVAALWVSPLRRLAVVWASSIVIVGLYYALRQRRTARCEALTRLGAHNQSSNPQFPIAGHFVGILPLIFFADASPGGQVIIACLCAGMLGGGAFALASIPAAAIAFTAPIVVASAIAIGRSGDAAYALVAILMISYISVLWRGIYVYASQIVERVAEQVKAEREVRRDELTSLPNRLAFFEELESAFLRHTRSHEQFAVLYLDLNDFKIVNDRRGHATGDKLLVEVGRRLRESVRQVDLVARLGGDEFAVVVANAPDAAFLLPWQLELLAALTVLLLIEGRKVYTGACVGIALAPRDGDNPELLLKSADEALYDAKHRPGGVIQLFDSSYRMRRVSVANSNATCVMLFIAVNFFWCFSRSSISKPKELRDVRLCCDGGTRSSAYDCRMSS